MRSIRPTALCGLLLGFLLALPPTARSQEGSASAEPGLRPGDRVEISMFSAAGEALNEIGGSRTVDRNGQIFLPFLGSLDAAGMGASEIRRLLERRNADFFSSPVVDVQTRIRVNITGSLRSPGNYYVDPTSTLVDVLSTAAGTRSEVQIATIGAAADPSRVRLVRGGQTRILDPRPESGSQSTLDLRVQSGDWLHVPPQQRSRWRNNIQFLGSIFSLVGSVATVFILLGN